MFDAFVRALASPAVRFWLSSSSVSRAAIPVPTGSTVVHSSGSNPARILLIGSGASVGFGVLSHELGLAGHIARQVSAVTGRAMDVDVVVDRELTAAESLEQAGRMPVARYEAIIVALGLMEALAFTPVEAWEADMTALVQSLTRSRRPGQQVFVVGIPPLPSLMRYPLPIAVLSGRHARLINERTRLLFAEWPRVTFLPFEPGRSTETNRFRSSATYGSWASLLSAPIAARLSADPIHSPLAVEADDEAARQASLDALNILDTAPEERFDRIASTARDLLGTASAAITFIDRDRHWFKSRVGLDIDHMPRISSLCEITIQRREHFAVSDARADPRFADNPMVVGEPHLRFYAGYPIEAPGGIRVGTLSVFDPSPREFTDADAALLRGLTLSVQNELRPRP